MSALPSVRATLRYTTLVSNTELANTAPRQQFAHDIDISLAEIGDLKSDLSSW